jgi:hypothetical protein
MLTKNFDLKKLNMTNSNVKERIFIKSLVAMLILMEFWFQLFLEGTEKERERERERERK